MFPERSSLTGVKNEKSEKCELQKQWIELSYSAAVTPQREPLTNDLKLRAVW